VLLDLNISSSTIKTRTGSKIKRIASEGSRQTIDYCGKYVALERFGTNPIFLIILVLSHSFDLDDSWELRSGPGWIRPGNV